jgi:sulfate/thiosulfate transport system substrate-binding protein
MKFGMMSLMVEKLSIVLQSVAHRLSRRWFVQWFVLGLMGLVISFTIAACNSNPSGQKDIELLLVGYSVPKVAHDAIIPKFVKQWEKDHNGQSVIFSQSYGGSGSQTRGIIDGLDADVVHLAIGSDMNKLVSLGFVNEDWTQRVPNQGIVGETIAAITTRPGNPKGIKSFGDLTRDDVKWVTPNPKTSGVARWNYYALLNHAKKTNQPNPQEFIIKAFKNVAVLTKDSREATDAFVNQGQGDALVNYENEAILAKQKGEKFDFTAPAINISIDTPVAVVDRNVDKHGNRAAAEAFVQFLFTPEAQREFAKVGFRPLGEVAQEPAFAQQYLAVEQLSKIEEYGGWKKAQKAFDSGGDFDAIESAMAKK